MERKLAIILVVVFFIIGLGIGYFISGNKDIVSYESGQNSVSFVVEDYDGLMASVYPFNCREEYKIRYGSDGTCEITKVTTQTDRGFIAEYGCRCWEEK